MPEGCAAFKVVRIGPHTCVSGYVWREAWAGDDVCVTLANRTLAAADNAQVKEFVCSPCGSRQDRDEIVVASD